MMFRHIFSHYFDNNVTRLADATGYSITQIRAWVNGTAPQNKALHRICSIAFAPSFKVVVEFLKVNNGESIHTQLTKSLGGHGQNSGIYAFYDARAQLLYIGKARKLRTEINLALNRKFPLSFPIGTKKEDVRVCDLVKYVSAYEVEYIDGLDYAKHIESLILRISKPPVNKNIGKLEKAHPDLALQ